MWNFERYQRWVAQKKDWVMPAAAEPLPPETRAAPPPIKSSPARPAKAAAPPGSGDSIEIPVEEVDLDELARRIEKRNL